MTSRVKRVSRSETPESASRYELRARRQRLVGAEYEIWQMPTVERAGHPGKYCRRLPSPPRNPSLAV